MWFVPLDHATGHSIINYKVYSLFVDFSSQELHSKGFILILDKRKDKWSGVKLALTRIQAGVEQRHSGGRGSGT